MQDIDEQLPGEQDASFRDRVELGKDAFGVLFTRSARELKDGVISAPVGSLVLIMNNMRR